MYKVEDGASQRIRSSHKLSLQQLAIGNFKFGQGAARAVVIVILLAAFSGIYLFFLEKVNRRYGTK